MCSIYELLTELIDLSMESIDELFELKSNARATDKLLFRVLRNCSTLGEPREIRNNLLMMLYLDYKPSSSSKGRTQTSIMRNWQINYPWIDNIRIISLRWRLMSALMHNS